MSTKTVSNRNDPLIENRDQLITAMAKGEKPKDRWRIGTEHEKFVYCTGDHHAPSYAEPGGITNVYVAVTLVTGSEVTSMARLVLFPARGSPVSL